MSTRLKDLDVVIPVKHGTQSQELRYMLRAVAKNLPHRDIYIVGHKPYWASNIKHLKTVQSRTYNVNVLVGLLRACQTKSISEDFILMDDDHFVMTPIKTLPPHHRGPTREVLRKYRGRNNVYIRTMARTAAWLIENGIKDPLCYEIHVPMIINKAKFFDLQYIVKDLAVFNKRSLYGNYYQIGGSNSPDVKVTSGPIPKGKFISTSDTAWLHRPVGNHIRKQFNKASKYERF